MPLMAVRASDTHGHSKSLCSQRDEIAFSRFRSSASFSTLRHANDLLPLVTQRRRSETCWPFSQLFQPTPKHSGQRSKGLSWDSFWDGLLIATAARAGCTFLLSEDMQDGARFGRVTILDPFVGEDLPQPVAELLR
jgi:hypothetical protein